MPQVNKIWVPVVPDARGFREDVKKTLQAAERTLTLTIPLAFDQSKLRENVRIALTGAQAQADRAPVTAQVDVDAAEARKKIHDLAKNQTATINADADTGKAIAQLALAARNRHVSFDVSVNKASLAKAGQAFAALAGARVAADAIKNIGTSLGSLDRAVPAIAGIATAAGSLGSVALSSVSGIVTLGASLAPLAALAAPLPGLLLAGGLAAGVFAAAMVDAGSQLGSLKPGFAALQDSISSKFWDQAKQPILDLVNGVLPSLQSGLSNVASSLGTWSASVAKSFQTAFSPEVIGTITGALSDSIIASTQGTDAFAASLASLGTFAAQYLPGIGDTFSNLSIRFNDFIQTVVGNGQLAGWVQEATAVLGQLGAVFSNTFGILGNIADAAFAAGGSGIQTLAGALQQINTITAGPAFQGALTTIFAGAASGAASLAAALGPIGDLLVGLAPSISNALTGLSSTAGALISGIASALNQPGIGAGLEAAVSGIAVGIQGLLPALPGLATAFGSLMGVVGTLASVIGPVLGTAFSLLSPIITSLGTALTPLISMLGPILSQAMLALSPLVTQLVTAFAPLVEAIMPLLSAYVAVVMPLLGALVGVLASLIPPIVQIVQQLSTALIPVFQSILPVVSSVVSAILPIVQSLADIIAGVVAVVSGLLTGNWSQVWQGAQQIVSGVFGVIRAVITGAISIISSVISSGLNLVRSTFSNVFGALGGIVSAAIGAVGTEIGRIHDTVLGALAGAGTWLVDVGRNIVNGLISGIKNAFGAVGSTMKSLADGAINAAKSALGIHSPSRRFRDEVGAQLVNGFVLGITANASSARSAVEDMAGYVPSLPSFSTSGAGVAAAGAGGVQKTYSPTFQNYGRDFTEQNFLNAMHQIDVLT